MFGKMIQTLRGTPEQEMGIVSPETLKERRALARRLMEGAVDTSPVAHWTQGAARMAQALQGVTADWAADREEKRGQEAWKSTEAKLFGGGAPAIAAEPAAMTSAAPMVASPNPSPVADVKGYDRPEAREIYDSAIKAGYAPHQAAAFTGAALAESAYRTDARNPGDGRDGSDSIGIFQWNSGRATGLKQFAEREGKDWRDRSTQVAYALQEKQGPESFAGQALRNAKTPEDATAAMLHYLRPAGYTRDNPMAAGSAGARLKNTNAILGLYGAQDAQPAVMRGEAPAAINAIATEGQTPPAQNVQMAQGAPAAPQMPAPAPASSDPVSGAPSRMSLAQLMAMRNSPAFAYAPKGTQELVSALIQRQVTQEARDPRDGMIKDLTIAEKRAAMARDAEMTPLNRRAKLIDISKGERDLAGYRPASPEEKARLGYSAETPIQIGPDGRAYADNNAVEKATQDQRELGQINEERTKAGQPALRLDEWKLQKGKASAPAVNIDQKSETEESKERGKGLAKFLNEEAGNAPKVAQRAADLDQLGALVTITETGIGTPGRAILDNIGRQLGFTDGQLSTKADAVNAIVNRIAPTLREAGSGTVSDADLRGFLASLPNLSATPDGNRLIMSTLKRASEIALARAQIAADWQGGEISGKDARRAIAELDKRSIYASPEERNLVAGLSKPKPGAPVAVPPSTPTAPIKRPADKDPLGLFQ